MNKGIRMCISEVSDYILDNKELYDIIFRKHINLYRFGKLYCRLYKDTRHVAEMVYDYSIYKLYYKELRREP